MNSETFKIKTEVFEGPLDLLLSLVEKRKLMINDISLASVTDEYIRHIEIMSGGDNASRAEFILVASTLLLIKSRSLLPSINLTDEEQENVEDLEMRLKILQIIRDGSLNIERQFGKQIIFPKSGQIKSTVFSPHKSITFDVLKMSVLGVINRFPKKESLQKALVKQVVSLEEVMDNLAKKIQSGLSLSFKQFSGYGREPTKEQKVEVIVGFLAMLELVKQGIVEVIQESHFEDIKMETTDSLGVPKYNS